MSEVSLPVFTVQLQRSNATANLWYDVGDPVHLQAADGVGAATTALRELQVRPRNERILLWSGTGTSGQPRIFHSGT